MASFSFAGTPPLAANFFARECQRVAEELIGALLVHALPAGPRVGRIVETEAYGGPEDRASHARFGLTERNRPMFGRPGRSYVYLIYGVHHCLNVVTEGEGRAAAVLLRAVEPWAGLQSAARGPGLLCRLMAIDRAHNALDLTKPPLFFLPRPEQIASDQIERGPRVGVGYAGEWASLPWRYWLRGSQAVSGRRRVI